MKQSSRPQPELSIVIPAYREAKRIGKTLDELAAFLKSWPDISSLNVEVLIVSADTLDDTHRIVLSKQKKFKNLTLLKPGPKVGKGRDVKHGMLRANGKAIMFMDADLATPLHHLPEFYKAFQNGDDIVVAVRNLRNHHPSVVRRFVSNAGNILFRIAGGVWIEDSQCGFKLFSSDAARLCFSKLTIYGWGFDMEVLAIAKTNKLKIRSYRVDDWRAVADGTFVDGIIKNSLHSLLELGTIAGRRLKGTYRTEVLHQREIS